MLFAAAGLALSLLLSPGITTCTNALAIDHPTHASNNTHPHWVPGSSLPFSNASESIDSYAGHITVRQTPKTNSSLFYWYFPALEANERDAPLLFWLQGGPGSSSMLGLFYEMGPLRVDFRNDQDAMKESKNHTFEEYVLRRNPYSWNRKYNMVFLDQPVGTGYSYVDPPKEGVEMDGRKVRFFEEYVLGGRGAGFKTEVRVKEDGFVIQEAGTGSDGRVIFGEVEEEEDPDFKDGYVVTEEGVGKDFITFLLKFYDLYPHLRDNDLHISSESYGGKYVPSIASAISSHNDKSPKGGELPLKTIAIGNEWTDPVTQIATHPDHFLNLGLIDDLQAESLKRPIVLSQAYTANQDWMKALDYRMEMFDMLKNFTGGIDWYDVRKGNQHSNEHAMNTFLRVPKTKDILHVDRRYTFGEDPALMDYISGDIMKSTKHLFPDLFGRYKVLLYQGMFDLRDGVISNTRWIETIPWEGSKQLKYSPRKVWTGEKGDLRGYVQEYGNLTRTVLWGCGHLVPEDVGCPESSLDMIERHIG